MEDGVATEQRRRSIRKLSQSSYITSRNAQNELRRNIKMVSEILKKPEQERTTQDKILVNKNPELVKVSQQNARRLQNRKERVLEVEDEPQVLLKKCDKLAGLIKSSKNVIVYTGAGISTAASIPDYRGPNGVWTLLKKGQELSPQDLSDAEPTFTHMSLTKLYSVKKVKHIVSQNCDGLHLRSGFPRQAISEVHGNMYIECCYSCVPNKEFVRLFDVTERTGFHRHTTSRHCRCCGGNLKDTIVHFGEKGKLKSPYRWKEAVRAAKRADLILCLGSSLKVLRKYSCLWCMDKKRQNRPKLVIVNLQWTPKDDVATLKINGKCDTVMMNVMALLNYKVPEYKREQDPIFRLYTPLRVPELKSTTRKILIPPAQQGKKSRNQSNSNISNAAIGRKSCRRSNSAEKHALWPDTKYFKPSVSSNYFVFNDAIKSCKKEIEKSEINSKQENQIKKDITVTSARFKLDQCRPIEHNTSTLNGLHNEPSCNVIDLKLSCLSDRFYEESIKSEFVTYPVPQEPFLVHLTPNHHWCDCQVQKEGQFKMICPTLKMCQHEQCRNVNCFSVRHSRHSSLENNGLYKHEDYKDLHIKSIPQLVVVNLGKNEVQNNRPLNTSDTVLFVNKMAADNRSNLVANVCEKSSSSTTVFNSSHTFDNVFCHQATSDDLTHSSSELHESSVQINVKAMERIVGQHLEVTVDSNLILLSARVDAVFDQCADSLLIRENSEYNCFGNNIIQKQVNKKILQTFQSVRQTLNNICHDHCYMQARTPVTHQLPTAKLPMLQTRTPVTHQLPTAKLPMLQTRTPVTHQSPIAKLPMLQAAKKTNQLDVTCVQSGIVDISTKDSLEICPFVDNISVSSLYTCKDEHNISQSSAECHPCIPTAEVSSNPGYVLADQRPHSDIYGFSDVPTCILNMDDMNIVYTEADSQPEMSLCLSEEDVNGHKLCTEPADVTLPWNYDILVLPSKLGQFHLSQNNELQTCKSNLLSDSCCLITEKSTFYCDQSRVHCLISNDLTAGLEVPVLYQPKLHSFIDTRCQNLSTLKNSDTDVPEKKELSFPNVENTSEALLNLHCDKAFRCHLKNTCLKFQPNLVKKEVANAVINKCHQVSEVLHVQEGNKKATDEQKNECKQLCRRKSSVPGWFGKGLIIKKKKKY
ncbi:hypothetical protein BsWGS_20239 [Bradybaena similaris]